jgi:hypothetical protein
MPQPALRSDTNPPTACLQYTVDGCLECAGHQELFSRSSAYRAFFREQPDKYPENGHVDERKHVIKY